MSATTDTSQSQPAAPDADSRRWSRLRPRTLALIGAVLVLFSIVGEIAQTDSLTAAGTIGAALRGAVPIGLAGLGGLWSERTGVVNIGLEGMMVLGTWAAGFGAWQYGIWWGVVLGVIGGALGGLLHAVATVSFGVDHIISGVAINILADGSARYLSTVVYTSGTGGGATQSPPAMGDIGSVSLPFLSGGAIGPFGTPDPLGAIDRTDIFLVSDVAGILKGLTADLNILTLAAILLIPVTWFILWRTPLGLRMRSVGERPAAAESLGVNVYAMKYLGVTISGALAGFGGSYLALIAASAYREGQVGGRGFIGLAATLFGNYRPTGVGMGSLLFGFADALRLRDGSEAVFALLLVIAVVLVVAAAPVLRRGRVSLGGVMLLGSSALLFWFVTGDEVPNSLVFITPYLLTLLVLTFASQRLRMPAANGQPYRRGQGE